MKMTMTMKSLGLFFSLDHNLFSEVGHLLMTYFQKKKMIKSAFAENWTICKIQQMWFDFIEINVKVSHFFFNWSKNNKTYFLHSSVASLIGWRWWWLYNSLQTRWAGFWWTKYPFCIRHLKMYNTNRMKMGKYFEIWIIPRKKVTGFWWLIFSLECQLSIELSSMNEDS